MMVRRYFECSDCATSWVDDWDCACNDRCPGCNREIEPVDTEEIQS